MHVDDHLANAKCPQASERNLQERAPSDFHQGFRAIVSQRPQARAEPGGQNHSFHCEAFIAGLSSGRLHLPSFSNSRWRTATSTPLEARKCFANCSARFTERCCPPVQPKDTIRFLKPRWR